MTARCQGNIYKTPNKRRSPSGLPLDPTQVCNEERVAHCFMKPRPTPTAVDPVRLLPLPVESHRSQ